MIFEFAISGPKADALQDLQKQVRHARCLSALQLIINASPGTHVNLEGTLSADDDRNYGSLEIKGSFWTKS